MPHDIYLVHVYGEPVSDWLDAQPSRQAHAQHDNITSATVYASQRRAPTLSEYDRDAN